METANFCQPPYKVCETSLNFLREKHYFLGLKTKETNQHGSFVCFLGQPSYENIPLFEQFVLRKNSHNIAWFSHVNPFCINKPIGHFRVPFASVSKRVQVRNLSYESQFYNPKQMRTKLIFNL